MKRRHKTTWAALAASLLAAGAASAEPTLAELIARARTASFDQQSAARTEEQRDAEADAQLGRLLPSFSARGVYTRNQDEVAAQLGDTRVVIQPRDQLDAFLQLDVPLLDLVSYYRQRSARELARAASAERRHTALEVERAVARTYYQYLGSSVLARAAEESTRSAEQNLELVDARRSSGAATDLDHARALANLERARQELADARLAVDLTARAIETLSGVWPGPATSFPEDDLSPEQPLPRWLARLEQAPIHAATQHATRAAELGKSAANATFFPTLSASAQQRFTNATGFLGETGVTTLSVTLGWRFEYGALPNVDAQSAALELARIRAERTRRAQADLVFESFKRVESGIVKSRSARVQADAAAQAAALASERYAAGVATQLDVTQAQRDAFLADASRIQADTDLAYSRAALRLLAGVPLDSRSDP